MFNTEIIRSVLPSGNVATVGTRGVSLALPFLPRFDPWRSLKVARQSAKRRAEGRWDNCGDPNRKASAVAHNALLTAEREARARRNERERMRRAAKRQQAMEAV